MSDWTRADLSQFQKLGIEPSTVNSQLARFKKGFPQLELLRPCLIEDGIRRIVEGSAEETEVLRFYEAARNKGRFSKFVPASGAASRMFWLCETAQTLASKNNANLLECLRESEDETEQEIVQFFDQIEKFAFAPRLFEAWRLSCPDPFDPSRSDHLMKILDLLLGELGLGFSSLSKALIPFHTYGGETRNPLDEHVAEGLAYSCRPAEKNQIHFTVSPLLRERISAHLDGIRQRSGENEVELRYDLSEQSPASQTLAVHESGAPFRNRDGDLVFRPGGHGALLQNLGATEGDLVFVKNIDNVAHESWSGGDFRSKRLLGGLVARLSQEVGEWISRLDDTDPAGEIDSADISEFLAEAREYWEQMFCCVAPPHWAGMPANELRRKLIDALDRPIRICSMVPNTGEPGGGPFWVRHADGSASVQIVELSQVDRSDPSAAETIAQASHFNPVDLAVSLKSPSGRPYQLDQFVDPESGLISRKHEDGVPILALELPGLWNGSMAGWNTVFLEAPLETFNPVKSVADLLRPAHQDELRQQKG